MANELDRNTERVGCMGITNAKEGNGTADDFASRRLA